ncbi:MAG: hybrid sensor histidine kinase/response regulator [Bacteroidetes bacterium]|nr:MAG: hybrid sensor histidine kinase/response regulator [Bacteroidota bacterium]
MIPCLNKLIITAIILLSANIHAGSEVIEDWDLLWRSHQISNEDGLSNSAVTSIYRDKRGFMWFGTWDGLNRYDGKNIKTFYPDIQDKNAISNNIIWHMLEDKHGKFWIVTENGINQYSHDLENFSNWFTGYPEITSREQSLKAQVGFDGNIWVSAFGLGLFRFNPVSGNFEEVTIPGLADSFLKRINDFFFYGNSIYLVDNESLIQYNFDDNLPPETIRFTELCPEADEDYYENSWFFELNNTPHLALSIRKGGLLLVNLIDFYIHTIQKFDPGFFITSIHLSLDKNHLWLGADDGNIFKLKLSEKLHPESVLHLIPELAGRRLKIWSVLETPDDLLWIGTDGEGIFRTIMKPKPFYQIKRGEPQERMLNHQIVRAIYEDKNGNLWVGTRGNGLNYIPAVSGPAIYYTTKNGLTNNAVLSLEEDKNGNLWIGHDGSGIDILELSTGKFYHFPADLKGAEDLEFGSVYDICTDTFGKVWLGTSGHGLIGLNIRKTNTGYELVNYKKVKGYQPDDILKSNIIYAIVEEKPNILWFGTRGAGIYRLNTITGELKNSGIAQSETPGLSDNDVLSLHMGNDGFLWVGTSGGLNMININYTPYSFKHFTTHDGLPNNTIHAILEDSEGNIWSSTNKGLSKFERANNTFFNFNSADGLQSNEYTDGAALKGKNSGRFYFGGINGLDWFYPEKITISQRKPELVFTGFRLYNKMILPGDSTEILQKNINELETITLKHHQNFFTIEFTTLNFINPDKSLFEYKLENFNTDWVFAGNQREVNFTNVPFGKYRLLVRATNEDGIWSDEIRTLNIVIQPPIWKTWPAFIIYIIIAGILIFLIYRYQSVRMRRKQERALEKIQQEKEKELNQYKLQFFTNLAHEFGTPLTLIFASAASLMNQNNDRLESTKLIKTIYQNSRRMQRLVQELLEFRKVDSGRERVNSNNFELVSTLNNITEIFTHFARENELELSFEPEIDELWVTIDGGKLEKIMLNLLSNAMKYTPAGGSIAVKLEEKEKQIQIEVSDTGIGIPHNSLNNIFESFYQVAENQNRKSDSFKGIGIGLAYTKSLVELLDGTISVTSKYGKGTTFKVILPCKITKNASDEIKYQPAGLINHSALLEQMTEEFLPDKKQKNKNIGKPELWTTPKKYRILIAEDDPELSNLLFRLLSEQYEILLAKNGQKALEIIQDNRVDLLVSDIIMPEMDGLTLCKIIKSQLLTSHIPVILLTAKAEIENRIEGLEMGADSYIPKPFHPKHLFVRIEKLLKAREQFSEYFKTNFGTSSYHQQNNFSARDKELLDKCVAFIEKNYGNENLDADILSDYLALSKAQLYRKIKALTGLTPHALIKNFRLKKARQMIAEGEYSVSDIIYMTGFNNRTYFYRSYKEIFGETPGELSKI